MNRSLPLRHEDIEEISNYYGLSILDFQPMAGGASNSNYLLSTQDEQLIVTVFDDKSFAHVSRLERLLRYLAVNGFSTTLIVPPDNERNPVMVYLNKPVLIKEYIPGDLCYSLERNMLIQVGGALGDLHQIPTPDFLPEEHAYGNQLFPSVVDENIDRVYEKWLSEQHEYLNRYLPIDLPQCLIHGDLFADNILFEGEELKAVIDFEEACQYYRVFDLGMGIVGMCTDHGKVDLAKARAFIGGYQQVQNLEAGEILNLQHFAVYAAVATSYWRYWKFNIHAPDPDKAHLHRQMVEVANEVESIAKDEFREAIFGYLDLVFE